ncbi:YHS domain protein [Photobacterium jeanii]|uniref:YHS domain protein n=1 Tax=Photobacterium jeanii TaxID=858640 RepID=A0A178K7K0_9GAMM|nr:YHS domain-containing (seleno)protein [Photobacterium jeanii]OAN13319.1 YHS domain protein [Photobacterium jeanii]PST90318.1 YHS domain-containing protein [Photobacterium jeanii]
MTIVTKLALVFTLWIGCCASAFALEPVYSDFFGKAIKGYDAVSYFTESAAVKGDSDFTYQWNGAKWYFSSEENRKAFVANPTKFAPQYGGYCAWAVSKGYTAKIDPHAWNIVEGKLYLNYSKSVQQTWQQDIKGNVAKADSNWPQLLAE